MYFSDETGEQHAWKVWRVALKIICTLLLYGNSNIGGGGGGGDGYNSGGGSGSGETNERKKIEEFLLQNQQ